SLIALGTSVFMLLILRTARHRFKAIAEDDKLIEKNTPKPRGTSLTDEQWERMRESSFEAFRDTILNRYDDEERRVILQACREGKDGLHMDRLLYERALGKGAIPSGAVYKSFDKAAIDEVYEGLTAEQIFFRMSGAGFNDLKKWCGIDNDDLKLWHIQKQFERERFLASLDANKKAVVEDEVEKILELSADELRRFLDEHTMEKRVLMMYDFLPKFTPWIVVVQGSEAVKKLMDFCVGYRYPLRKLRFIFAGENWDEETYEHVQRQKERSTLPPNLIFRGMPVREDNLNAEDIKKIKKMSREERKKRIVAWIQATQPYTKPGANTAVLDDSDGTSGIIYDAENTPLPNQPLQFILGVMDGITKTRHLLEVHFAPALDSRDDKTRIKDGDSVGEMVKTAAKRIKRALKHYEERLTERERSQCYQFNFKQKRILKRHLKYFARHTLRTLLEVEQNNPKLLSTGMLFEEIKRQIQSGRSPVKDKGVRELINLYVVLCNMPGYGRIATDYIKRDMKGKDAFIQELIKAEFKRINEPRNGQGRLAKITNALAAAGPDKPTGSQGQVAAYMYAEYASWYDPGWSGFHAAKDTFKPLGGTTGYFCTEAVEEIDWKDEDVKNKLHLEETDITAIKEHYDSKNKILTLGAWDEFQVAEDYMLGFVAWWYGFNIAGFYSLTPEDPAGFEAEVGYKFRPKQISRWIKGYIIGWLILVEKFRNMWELRARKGLWGYIVFLVPTLSSAINPLLFIAARFITQFWWIFFVPLGKIFNWMCGLDWGIGHYVRGFFEATQFDSLFLGFQEFIRTFIPESLNFLNWATGAPIVILPFVLHVYFTLRGIFRGIDNRVGIQKIIEEHEELLENARKLEKDVEKGNITREEYNAVICEIEDRLEAIKTGDISRKPGLVSPQPFITAASAVVGACLAVMIVPFIHSFWVTLLTGIVWTAGFTALLRALIIRLAEWYINAAPDPEEKRIRGMIVRAAAPSLFICFYHGSIYLPGNVIAWTELLSGGRAGYWWRTPRVVELLEQVKERHIKKELIRRQFSKKEEENAFLKMLAEKVWTEKELEFDLEQTRLYKRLIYAWGFIGGMLLFICYGFRANVRDHFVTSILTPFIEGTRGSMPFVTGFIISNPFIFISAAVVILSGGVFAAVKYLKYRKEEMGAVRRPLPKKIKFLALTLAAFIVILPFVRPIIKKLSPSRLKPSVSTVIKKPLIRHPVPALEKEEPAAQPALVEKPVEKKKTLREKVTAPAVSVGINYRGPLGAQSYGQNFGTTAWYPRGNGISRH
ncbi:MAG: hypothetical protein DRP85_08900, partial [Candidatus Makaraimicrobium thalassicum]